MDTNLKSIVFHLLRTEALFVPVRLTAPFASGISIQVEKCSELRIQKRYLAFHLPIIVAMEVSILLQHLTPFMLGYL